MAKAKEILSLRLLMPAERDIKKLDIMTFEKLMKLAAIQLRAMHSVLMTQTRVDETKLRRAQMDVLPRLMAMIAEEKKSALLIEAPRDPSC